MKSVCRKLKLRKFRTDFNKEVVDNWRGNEFLVIYSDGTTEHCICKSELYDCLSKDHIKGIRYIFDMTDRICVSRDIVINTDLEEE